VSLDNADKVIEGGPPKPGFGLSGDVLQLDRVFLPFFRVLVSSISTRSPPSDANTKHKVPFDFLLDFARSFGKIGRPSTPQIIAFAMISSGRDDRVGMCEQ